MRNVNTTSALLLLTLLASGCATNSPESPSATPVLVQRQMQLPPLPESARQKPAPSECSPTCLEKNNTEQELTLQRLMRLAPQD